MRNFRTLGAHLAKALCFCLLLGGPALATEWPKSDIPPDPAVTFGVLPNGMRYAIMNNNTPTGEVSVRLRIAAGSMQESDAQRGLAHFLEHMAFRGSAHTADGEINKTLERLGLSFGSDTNASTGQEQTVYQFDLPRSDDQTVDTVLGFTREIASNLNLDDAAAKTEAGVVLSELRLRDSPSFRAMVSQLDFLLQDKHATALPNGDAAIIGQASTKLIRDYYHAYYRPDRATLVVVGDIDPAKMEAKIKARFSDWQGAGAAGTDPKLAIPQSRGVEAKVYAEPGASSSITLAWTGPPAPKPDDRAQEKSDLIKDIGLRILNHRLQQEAASSARPFTRAGASRESVMQAVELTRLSIGYDPDQWQPALDAAERIRVATLQSGVSQAEVDRVVAEYRASFQARSAGAATRPSRAIVNALLSEIGENDVYTSAARDLAVVEEDLRGLAADTVNQAMRSVFQGGGPLIFVSGPKPVAGAEQAILAAFAQTEKAALAAPATAAQEVAEIAWPYTDFGKPGTVVKTTEAADLATHFVQFANGVRLTVRPSQLRANQVLVSVKVGGGRLDLAKDRITPIWAASAVTAGGLRAMSSTDMQRVLTGKHFGVGFSTGEDGFSFSGATTPGDIDTQLQVLAAYVSAPGFRPEAFEQTRSGYAARLRQADTSPATIFQLKVPEILHGGDKRWASPTSEEVQSAKLQELQALLAPALASGAIDVTIVGDISVDKAIQSVAATFGAFPARAGTRARVRSVNDTRFPAGAETPIKIATGTPGGQAVVSMVWPTQGRFPDIQGDATLQLMSAIMQERLFDKLRGLGTVYVAQVGNASSKVFDYGYVQALAQLPVDAAGQFYEATNAIVADLAAGKLTQDDLDRAKNPALQELRKLRQTNEYWLSALDDTQQNPGKLDLVRKYEAALQQVSAADIAAKARKYLKDSRMLKLVVQ